MVTRTVGTHQPVCTVSWPNSSQYDTPFNEVNDSNHWSLFVFLLLYLTFSHNSTSLVLNSSALVTWTVNTKYFNQNNIPFFSLAKCFETALYHEEKPAFWQETRLTTARLAIPWFGDFWGMGRNSPPPQWAMASSFVRFLDHTQWRTTVGRTPLDEWSARRWALYLTTHNTHNSKHPCPGGIRARNLSRRAAEDLRLRPRGHWGRPWDI